MHEELVEKGTEYLQNRQFEKALDSYRQAADQGSYLAAYNIACMYYFGDGVKKDDAMALAWFLKAAEAGDPEGANHAGIMLERGIGCIENRTEAFRMYRQAAENGSLGGMANLALCYLEEKGTEKNISSGLEWMRKASEGGNGIASDYMGDCYRTGRYVDADPEEAVNYYRRGLNQKYAPAVRNLAEMTGDRKEAAHLNLLADRMEQDQE